MTFLDLAQHVADSLAPDGDSTLTIPEEAPYYSTAWGRRLAIYLSRFTRETLLLFTIQKAITVSEGDLELDLSDAAVCDLQVFRATEVWLANTKLERVSGAGELLACLSPTSSAGTPRRYAQLDDSKILFDVTVSADLDDCYVRGFYRHPAIASDSTTIEGVTSDYLDLFSAYAQAYFRENVTADDIGASRLQRLDQQAYGGIQELRTRRTSRMLGSSWDRC